MSYYRRANFPGGYYFFTVVAFNRRNLFAEESARECLRHAWSEIKKQRPFELIALCLLPNHLHCIWKLPDNDADFSTRWSSIKGIFSREYLKNGGLVGDRNKSRERQREAALWQRRFWEHQIRDEDDLQKHINYIHYNPLKHGLVESLEDWPWSTYHRFVKDGFYGEDIVLKSVQKISETDDFGE